MVHQLIFATNNVHKLQEVAAKIGDKIKLYSLDDIGCYDDIAETGATFRENAAIKSHFIHNKYKLNCFADDSGLEIDALNGEPGVYSARYSGTHGNHTGNIDKVLKKLGDSPNRRARFRTVISLIWDNEERFFEGVIEGTIRREAAGKKGFGYYPIFQPDGYDRTFGEMSLDQKNSISHRSVAIDNLLAFLATV